MQKHFFTALLFILLHQYSHSQVWQLAVVPHQKGTAKNIITSWIESGEVKCLSLISDNEINRVILNKNDSLLKIFKQVFNKDSFTFKLYKNELYAAGGFANNQLKELYFKKTKQSFYLITTDTSSMVSENSLLFSFPDNENYISALFKNDFFYAVTAIRNTDSVCIYKIKNRQSAERTVVFANTKSKIKGIFPMLPEKPVQFSDLFKPNEFLILKENVQYPPEISSSPRKVFVRENGYVFSVNTFDYFTHLIFLNLDSLNLLIKSFDQNPKPDNRTNIRIRSGSWLFGDSLITVHTVDKDKLRINFFTLQNSTPFHTILITEKNISTLTSEKIVRKGDEETVSNLKNLTRTINAIGFGVWCYPNKDELYIKVSSVYRKANLSDFLAIPVVASANILLTTLYLSLPYNIDFGNVSFRMVANRKNIDPIFNAEIFDVNEFALKFTETYKLDPENIRIFYANNQYYLIALSDEPNGFTLYRLH